MKSPKKEGILLESGTNEIEIMKFRINDELYGINVAKVKEIMMAEHAKPMPHSHPSVEGFFKPRESLITVVNLTHYLTGEMKPHGDRDLFIITNFNKIMVAFRVDSIDGISRISWKAIQKPDKTLGSSDESVATGIAQCEGKLVTILDFEKIIAEIAPETTIQMSEIDKMGDRSLDSSPVLIAEDSVLLQKMIEESLERAGYTDVKMCSDGQEAWDYLASMKGDTSVYDKVNIIITDLEMPRMDGHRLTKLVKEDPILRHIPLIIFSSLINEQMREKGKSLGADEQLSKPEIGHLVNVMDVLIARFKTGRENGFHGQ